jgi:hypothetical protein
MKQLTADPCCGPFALKHFIGRDAQKNYRRDLEGFKRLMQSPEIPKRTVGFYGSFSQAESYNMILEYADGGTLDRYFPETRKPSTRNPEKLPKLDFQTAKQWRIDCKNRVGLPKLPDLWASRDSRVETM